MCQNNKSQNNYHFPAFCWPLLILSFKECSLLIDLFLCRIGRKYLSLLFTLSFGFVTAAGARPGAVAVLPLWTDFHLLPADLAWIGILLPLLSLPPVLQEIVPPKHLPNLWNAVIRWAFVDLLDNFLYVVVNFSIACWNKVSDWSFFFISPATRSIS